MQYRIGKTLCSRSAFYIAIPKGAIHIKTGKYYARHIIDAKLMSWWNTDITEVIHIKTGKKYACKVIDKELADRRKHLVSQSMIREPFVITMSDRLIMINVAVFTILGTQWTYSAQKAQKDLKGSWEYCDSAWLLWGAPIRNRKGWPITWPGF